MEWFPLMTQRQKFTAVETGCIGAKTQARTLMSVSEQSLKGQSCRYASGFFLSTLFATIRKLYPPHSFLRMTLKTAWFLLQKIRKTFQVVQYEKLDGEVELDETFVGGKNKNRHANKKVGKCQGRSFKDKVPVMGMLQRGGKVVCKVVHDTSSKSLTAPILRTVKRTATLFTDEWGGYNTVRKVYKTRMVDHGKGLYVDGDAYTNTIEGFWGNYCKRVVHAIYNRISRKYMQRYFNEFCFRYNNRNVSNVVRFETAIANTNIRITQKQLVA